MDKGGSQICVRPQKSLPLHRVRENALLFIRLVVNRFKVKIMLLDFPTTVALVSAIVITMLSIITLVHTNIR